MQNRDGSDVVPVFQKRAIEGGEPDSLEGDAQAGIGIEFVPHHVGTVGNSCILRAQLIKENEEKVGIPLGVVVKISNDTTRCMLEAHITSPSDACSYGKGDIFDPAVAELPDCSFRLGIVACIVDNDQFPILIGLHEHRNDRIGNNGCAIARGHDDRDQRALWQGRVVGSELLLAVVHVSDNTQIAFPQLRTDRVGHDHGPSAIFVECIIEFMQARFDLIRRQIFRGRHAAKDR